MQIGLIWQSGKTGTTTLDIEPGQSITIGRGMDADLRLNDSRLSRSHCTISRAGGEFVLEDLDSQNGTFVNGKRIKKCALAHGDRIVFGGMGCTFSSKAESETTSIEPSSLTAEIKMRFDPRKKGFLSADADLADAEGGERVKRDLATIYKISNLVSSEQNPDLLLQGLLETIMEAIPADRGFVLFLGEGGLPLEIVARAGSDKEISFSQTVVGETVRNGTSILTTDAVSDARFRTSESIVLQNLRSIMCVPLEGEDHIIGAIYLDTRSLVQRFSEQDLHLLAAIGSQAGMAIQRAKLVNRLQVLFFDTVRALVATIETKDPYTKGHSERVAALAVQIASDLDISPSGRRTIQLAGLMHDIGKIGVPERILNKPGHLTKSEYEMIQRHPVEGIKIIQNIRYVENLIGPVLHHHERWNGNGYPDHKTGTQIPLGARIISVADAFDAMTSARPYRSAIPVEEAIQELETQAGQQFDPEIVGVFVNRVQKGGIKPPDHSFSQTIHDGLILKDDEKI